MYNKSIFRVGILTLLLCLTAGCMNNENNKIEKNDGQEIASNDDELIKGEEISENDVKEDNKEISKYDIITKTYEKGSISIKYPQFKTKSGSDDDFTRKWNKIIEDDSMSGMAPNSRLDDPGSEESFKEDGFWNVSYEVKTNNNKVISIVFSTSYCFYDAAHPYSGCHAYNIDVSTGEQIELQDDPNFSTYAENIFYDKNYSVKSSLDDDQQQDRGKNYMEELKENIYVYNDLRKNNVSELKSELMNHRFYYENGKVVILFEVNHMLGDYAYLVME